MISIVKEPNPILNEGGAAVQHLRVGVGWESGSGGKKGWSGKWAARKGVDLDLSVIARNAEGVAIGGVYHANLKAFGGAMIHTGDNKTGKGDGYDEQAVLALNQIPDDVERLDVCLSSFKGADFSNITEAKCGLIDESTGTEIGALYLPIEGDKTACLIARLRRNSNGGWDIQKDGTLGYAATWNDMKNFGI